MTAAPIGLKGDIRRDIRIIGVVGAAHGGSHFFQLVLPPRFPWLSKVLFQYPNIFTPASRNLFRPFSDTNHG